MLSDTPEVNALVLLVQSVDAERETLKEQAA